MATCRNQEHIPKYIFHFEGKIDHHKLYIMLMIRIHNIMEDIACMTNYHYQRRYHQDNL